MKLTTEGHGCAALRCAGDRVGARLYGRGTALALALLVICGEAGCRLPFGRKKSQATGPASAGVLSAAASGPAYEGAWFRIVPPSGFTTRPSLKSSSANGHDSAFFDAPDGRAVFYVCASRRGRDASDAALNPATEGLLSDQSAKSGGESIRQIQIEAQDGSYERLVEFISSADSRAQWVFGFQYSDSLAFDEYLDRYKKFKMSLEQFSE